MNKSSISFDTVKKLKIAKPFVNKVHKVSKKIFLRKTSVIIFKTFWDFAQKVLLSTIAVFSRIAASE